MGETMKEHVKGKIFITLGILQLFIAVAAISAGLLFIVDPSGEKLGMTVQLIERSHFNDYLVPGIILFTVHGLGSVMGAITSLLKKNYSGKVGTFLGVALMIWIVVQVYWMGLESWLQPFMFLLGAIELGLSVILIKGTKRHNSQFQKQKTTL